MFSNGTSSRSQSIKQRNRHPRASGDLIKVAVISKTFLNALQSLPTTVLKDLAKSANIIIPAVATRHALRSSITAELQTGYYVEMLPEKLKPGLYRLAKVLRPVLPYGILANLGQWFTAYAHEPDFEIFEKMTGTPALVLDVGACRGQSALSILRRARHMRVVSIEPNPKHRWSLLLIGLLHPSRFRFHMLAAGDQAGRETLHVPGKRASGLSAQGSLDPTEFDKDYVQDRLAEDGFDATDKSGYRHVPVQVMPLDSLGLAPDMIKLDVEGFEYQALKGLQQTLCSNHPALLIEVNNKQRWLPFLTDLGYTYYHFDPVNKMLETAKNPGEKLNLFCLHKASDTIISRILLENVKK